MPILVFVCPENHTRDSQGLDGPKEPMVNAVFTAFSILIPRLSEFVAGLYRPDAVTLPLE